MEKVDMKKTGSRLRELRKQSGKTIKEMAQELNVSESSYAQYEQGLKRPRDDVKCRIANYYNTSVQNIFFA